MMLNKSNKTLPGEGDVLIPTPFHRSRQKVKQYFWQSDRPILFPSFFYLKWVDKVQAILASFFFAEQMVSLQGFRNILVFDNMSSSVSKLYQLKIYFNLIKSKYKENVNLEWSAGRCLEHIPLNLNTLIFLHV